MSDLQQMNAVLRPVAPPRVLEPVYAEAQYERILDVIRAHGPWPTITAHHFDTVEELIATSSGPMPEGEASSLTLDDIATAHFRGYFGKDSISFFPNSTTASSAARSSSSPATTGAPSSRSRRTCSSTSAGRTTAG